MAGLSLLSAPFSRVVFVNRRARLRLFERDSCTCVHWLSCASHASHGLCFIAGLFYLVLRKFTFRQTCAIRRSALQACALELSHFIICCCSSASGCSHTRAQSRSQTDWTS